MGSIAPFLIWLICVGAAAILIGMFIKNGGLEATIIQRPLEGFEMQKPIKSTNISISTCPQSSSAYVNKFGDTNCCDSDIIDGQCSGNILCSLSPSVNGVKSCSDWLKEEWNRRSINLCAASMPNYFGTMIRVSNKEGCSASPCTRDGTAPEHPSQPQCKMYNTQAEELANVDSCYNIAARDAMVCPQAYATKEITPSLGRDRKPLPALLKCNYTPANGSSNNIPVNCIDLPRLETYLQAMGENQEFIDNVRKNNSDNVIFCPASKAFYVDGSLTKEKARGLPNF
jgi:hypothetical protein